MRFLCSRLSYANAMATTVASLHDSFTSCPGDAVVVEIFDKDGTMSPGAFVDALN